MSASDLLRSLARCVGEAHVRCAESEMAAFLLDWRGRYRGRALAVVQPATTDEVAAVVRHCRVYGVHIVPQGGNTGLVGGATPLEEQAPAIVLHLGRLRRIRSLEPQEFTVVAEAGVTVREVQEAARSANRLFPLSLASEGSATVGGVCATNAGGVHVLRYGTTRDLVLGLEVVLADGSVISSLQGLRKDNTGYAWKPLFVGSEGTLGVITAATFKLFPLSTEVVTAWVAVPDPAAAVRLFSWLRETVGEGLEAFELMGRTTLELVLKHIPQARVPFSGEPPAWSVLVEFAEAGRGAQLQERVERAMTVAIERGWVQDVALAANEAQRRALWALRENASEAQRFEGFSFKHDVSLPIRALPEFIAECEARLRRHWPTVTLVCFGHLGDGNLHYNVFPTGIEPAQWPLIEPRLSGLVHDTVAEFGGSISAEHGIGRLKAELLPRYKSEEELSLLRRLKAAIDPENLFNPGKVVRGDDRPCSEET
ncbi:FAD-binding oxidoreductase [Tepidiphilus baoligensis]|uniref:FAD-binding protein n=1 Tax=Tepidiphilus baoligensis TaxID=2698687 RepID=A0ABX1QNG8_9PROT|nr:FAD-binding oxidoreductase [Tepidiphilus baoligensis]NMH17234.1 FAD-binding protein [Tepidiphilus baoligensis]